MSSDAPPLTVDILGDSGQFSRNGKSIGYRVKAGGSQFLVDCGAPVFPLLGSSGLAEIDGIVGTHVHEDHKRWFTDMAFHQKFTNKSEQQIHLLASKQVLNDYRRSSIAAFESTLSPNSQRIENRSYDEYIKTTQISPDPKYRIEQKFNNQKKSTWRIVDNQGNVVPRDRARIFPQEGKSQPRFLLKDPENGRWVEPATYYSFDDKRFYETESFRPYHHPSGLHITPIKATAWHGPPTTSLLFEFEDEQIFFSSDTIYNPSLWNQLSQPQPPEKHPEDHDSYLLHGDINDYNEQIWSKQRFDRANSFYNKNLIMIHDVSNPRSAVHTDYRHLENLENPFVLTHSPDVFTSLHPLSHPGKTFVIEDNEIQEVTENANRFPLNADCYLKEFSDYYVGYYNPEGHYALIRKESGQFEVKEFDHTDQPEHRDDQRIQRIDLYKEISGDYFPVLETNTEKYVTRPDGLVEKVHYDKKGSRGILVDGQREQLAHVTEQSAL